MSKLIVLRGLPGSGKSTKAQELIKQYGNFVRVNKDLLRTMLHFDKFSGVNEGITQKAQLILVRDLLKSGTNVIVDDTNLGESHEAKWKGIAKEVEAGFEIVDMDIGWEECVKRDFFRGIKVGASVIIGMARKYQVGGYDLTLPEIICDIDGTLANAEARVSALEKDGVKDWDTFFANVKEDKPRQEIIDIVKDYYNRGKRIVLVSGRPEHTRKDTEEWLALCQVPYHVLFMRKDGDRRPDTLVKAEILKYYFNKDKVELVIDDRPSVLRVWREELPNAEIKDVGKGVEF